MKPYVIAATLLVVSSTGFAQQDLYTTQVPEAPAAPSIAVPQTAVAPTAQTAATEPTALTATPVQQRQPIVIMNQPNVTTAMTPEQISEAEKIRKSRETLEAETQRKINERLEQSRLHDEQTRMDRLLVNQPQTVQPQATTTVPQTQLTTTVITAPQVAPAVTETAVADDLAQPVKPRRLFLTGNAGLTEYTDATNVRGKYATGFGLGVIYPNRVSVEGLFSYSRYEVEQLDAYGYSFDPYYPWFKELTQYNFGGAVKFRMIEGEITPVVGAIATIVRRSYKDNSGYSNQTETSTAFDVGALAGVDFKVNENFSIGGDFRYFANVGYKAPSPKNEFYGYREALPQKPVERMNYYILGVNATLWF